MAVVSNDAPPTFTVGDNIVTWTVTDTAGNVQTAIQIVTVKDLASPAVTCQPGIVKPNDPGQCSASVSFDAVSSDNCGVATTIYSVGSTEVASTYVFSVGT